MKNIDLFLQQIQTREADVRAWAFHDPETVRSQLAQHHTQGSLAGLPVGIKDLYDTLDMPTAYGSQAYAGHQPVRDSWTVQRLKAAGAIIMGKTITTEFAYVHAGPTRNPHNLKHTPGGSSSGSAAAVAAGMVPVAIGSQTGGSVIRPSAYCGVVGFKPTHGLIPLEGAMALSPSLDTVGIHAISVALTRQVFQVLALRAQPRTTPLPKRLRIGWYPGPNANQAQPQALKRLEEIRHQLIASEMAEIVDFAYDHATQAALCDANRLIMHYEASRLHQPVYHSARDKLGAATLGLIERGLAITAEQYDQTLQQVHAAHADFVKASATVDAVLTLSSPGEAPLFEEGTGSSLFNQPWTTLGVPCITLPAGTGELGLPLAIQLIGSPMDDCHLLDVAQKVQQICKIA